MKPDKTVLKGLFIILIGFFMGLLVIEYVENTTIKTIAVIGIIAGTVVIRQWYKIRF